MDNQSQVELLRFQLRKKEANAKAVPYISFILTHVALVLFLLLSFVSDQLLGSVAYGLAIKIALAVLAVLFLASEWIYAIVTSRRWKRDILLLLQLEEEQRHHNEQERLRKQEEMIAAEQLKNRMLLANLQRQRSQIGMQGQSSSVRSLRPDKSGAFSSSQQDGLQYPFPSLDNPASSYPSRQTEW